MQGTIIMVATTYRGCETTAAVDAGAAVVPISDDADLPEAAVLTVGNDQVADPVVIEYTSIDRDALTLTLAQPTPIAIDEGTELRRADAVVRTAYVQADAPEDGSVVDMDTVACDVPAALRPWLTDGARTPEEGERVEFELLPDGTYRLADLYDDRTRWVLGDPSGTHTVIGPDGLSIYDQGEDGPVETTHIGSSSADIFSIGSGRAIIDNDGAASLQSLAVAGSVNVYGEELSAILDRRPRGIVAWACRNTDGDVSDAESTFVEIAYDMEAGRCYRIQTSDVRYSYLSQTDGTSYIRWRATTNGTQPTTSSPQVDMMMIRRVAWNIGLLSGGRFDFLVNCTTSQTYRGVVTASTDAGVSLRLYGTASAGFQVFITDVGPVIPDTGVDRAMKVNSTPSEPPPATKKSYTSVWESNGGGTYRGNGTLRTDTTDLRQGYVGQANGDQHGLALFTAGAISGETGKTIASAMSGATIVKAEVYLYANHWYWASGGTALISAHNLTSATNATPATAKKSVAGWKRSEGRWVDITSLWSTSSRGIWVGKTGSSSLTTYGWFNGAGASSNRPRLRITYTRTN